LIPPYPERVTSQGEDYSGRTGSKGEGRKARKELSGFAIPIGSTGAAPAAGEGFPQENSISFPVKGKEEENYFLYKRK
jgi:hypothetical protein